MKGHKIMFFTDDDQEDLHLMKEITDSLGHSSQLFHDGVQMLSLLNSKEIKPDIIFLDITMPKLDGSEILKKIRSLDEDYNGIPIVIHSANCDEKCISKCFELGANYYITKAYSFKDLRSALENAINKDWITFKATREDFLHIHP